MFVCMHAHLWLLMVEVTCIDVFYVMLIVALPFLWSLSAGKTLRSHSPLLSLSLPHLSLSPSVAWLSLVPLAVDVMTSLASGKTANVIALFCVYRNSLSSSVGISVSVCTLSWHLFLFSNIMLVHAHDH